MLTGANQSDVPDIKVSFSLSASATTSSASRASSSITHMRRLGHSRHLSLDHNTATRGRRMHFRNRSHGNINPNQLLPMSALHSNHGSHSNLSMMSNASVCGSEISTGSEFLKASQMCTIPDPDKGYDFAQHFNLYSQYTANLALEYGVGRKRVERGGEQEGRRQIPAVWCMAFWNRVIAVGCSNGQVEVRLVPD